MIKSLIPTHIRHKIKCIIHSGKKFECPICGYKSRDFYPIGIDLPVLKEKQVVGAGLRKAGCYSCKSSDRERLVYIYLVNKLNILSQLKDYKILHIAPEKNISEKLIKCNFENYICGDLHTEGYIYPNYVKNINVTDIPFEDNYFDLIICNHVLEHVPNDILAMEELFRVLKKNGRAILQVPISVNSENTFEDDSDYNPQEREVLFGQFDHVRIYGKDYSQRLKSVGFSVIQENISEEFYKYGIARNENIFIGVKS